MAHTLDVALAPQRPLYSSVEEQSGASQEAQPLIIKVVFQSRQQMLAVFEEHKSETIEMHATDIIDMVCDLRSVSRGEMLQAAVAAWFYHALNFNVTEVECHEQSGTGDNLGGLLLFRVRLQADHASEVGRLSSGQELTGKYRDALIGALPGGPFLAIDQGSSLEQMLQISWTRGGSIELGGVAALGLVVLIVMALGVGVDYACPNFCSACPCFLRRREEYLDAVRELKERGAEFCVGPDGSAQVRVLPKKGPAHHCLDGCTIN